MTFGTDMREHRTDQAIKVIDQLADHLLHDEITEYEQSKIDTLQESIWLLQTALADLGFSRSIAQFKRLGKDGLWYGIDNSDVDSHL
jgi:hypothetical protein